MALAAAGLWVASRATWVDLTSADGLGAPQAHRLSGETWFGLLTPAALVLLAAIAALFAIRGALVRVFGVVLTLAGLAVAVPAVALLAGTAAVADRAGRLAELPARAQVTAATTHTWPAVVTCLAAGCMVLAGLALLRRPAAAGGLSARYAAPGPRRDDAVRRAGESAPPERVLWDALDAGTDPTDHDPTPPTTLDSHPAVPPDGQ
ncbi:TIGR02234 family membrane protein [Skermania piniformis]|uniref:TIGR02234 family membrane protein n=2 Tax=Skermania pinensis TaxID=39122 RepID=A0ABX8SDA8_9ACTN|nr:TIGR02234 family membrane protein [Skermania piniformis]